MRRAIHSDEEIREIGLRLRAEKGSVTVEELTAAVRGANKRIRRIVQEINGDVPVTRREPQAEEVVEVRLPEDLPLPIREEMSRLEEVLRAQLRRSETDADARARASEQALRSAHADEIAALRAERQVLERYLEDMDAALAGTTEQRDAAQEAVEDHQSRLEKMETLLREERAMRTSERERLEGDLRETLESERRSSEARHASDVAATRAAAELALEREQRQRLEERCSALHESREALHQQVQTASQQLTDLRRELDAERSTARRLGQVLADHLDEPRPSIKSSTRRKGATSPKAP